MLVNHRGAETVECLTGLCFRQLLAFSLHIGDIPPDTQFVVQEIYFAQVQLTVIEVHRLRRACALRHAGQRAR